MYFRIEKKKIINLLSKFNSYISKSKNNSILSNILLILYKKKLKFIVTSLDIEINAYIFLNDDNFNYISGSVTVNLNKLYELCRNFSNNENIYFLLSKNRLKIFCLNSLVYLSILPVNDFPIFKKDTFLDKSISIFGFVLKKIISLIYFSIGDQDIFFYLNGMLIEYKKNNIYFVTTDSYRISFYNLKDNFIYNKDDSFSFILSRKLVLILLKLFNDINDDNIFLNWNNNIIKITFSNFIIYSSLIDGSFPDYKNIILSTKDYKYIDIDILEFKNCLMRVSVISGALFSYVTFLFKKNFLYMISNDSNNNEIKEKIFINYFGENLEISFNIKYILDIIKSINKDKKLRFFFKNSDSIAKIISLSNKFAIYMLMPIKL